jgi:hypothetical protein
MSIFGAQLNFFANVPALRWNLFITSIENSAPAQ